MKRTITSLVLLCGISLLSIAQGTKMSREEYIEKYAKLAVQEMQRVGIPASITLAQACLESSNGNSDLSIASNNHFGIKCLSSWQGKRRRQRRMFPRLWQSLWFIHWPLKFPAKRSTICVFIWIWQKRLHFVGIRSETCRLRYESWLSENAH